MKVTVVSVKNKIEFEEKLNVSLRFVVKDNALESINEENTDIVFFPDLEVKVKILKEIQKACPSIILVFNAVGITIEHLKQKGVDTKRVIGMNLLPTFINRPLAEITLDQKNSAETQMLVDLGWEIKQVESRVGMVTPRVVFMIINEAYFTVQEGTASRADIDTGMKLGTNYPFGPFEWSQKIGVQNIYQTLKLIYKDTNEGRYKVCPLLKKEAHVI